MATAQRDILTLPGTTVQWYTFSAWYADSRVMRVGGIFLSEGGLYLTE